MPRPFANSKERVGQRIVWRDVLRAWHLRQRRSHQRAPKFLLPRLLSVSACTSPSSGYGSLYCAAPLSPTCSNLTNGTSNKAPSGATAPTTSVPRVVDHNNSSLLSICRHQSFQSVRQYLFAPLFPQNRSPPAPITGTAISIAPPPLRTSLYRSHQRPPQYL